MHLPSKPQLEGIWPPPTLYSLVPQVVLCIQLVWLEEVRRPAGIGLLQDVSVPRQQDAALQRHPLQKQSAVCAGRSGLNDAAPQSTVSAHCTPMKP